MNVNSSIQSNSLYLGRWMHDHPTTVKVLLVTGFILGIAALALIPISYFGFIKFTSAVTYGIAMPGAVLLLASAVSGLFLQYGYGPKIIRKAETFLKKEGFEITDLRMNRNQETALDRAIEENDLEMVQILVQLGAPLNEPDGNGFTPLTRAVTKGNLAMVEKLKKLGADLNKIDGKGLTPLICAVARGDLEMVKNLKEWGADLNKPFGEGITPLIYAVSAGDLDMVKMLKELGVDLNKPCGEGITPLTYAVSKGNLTMVEKLKEWGADLNKPCGNGVTPLYLAVSKGNLAMVKKLKELGVDLNKLNEEGHTTLSNVMAENNGKMVEKLIELGADKPLAEELYYLHRMTTAWGLKEGSITFRGKPINLKSGGTRVFGLSFLNEALDAFFKEEQSIPAELNREKPLFLEVFKEAYPFVESSANQIVERVNQGKPVLISVSTFNHAFVFLIYKGRVALCNRAGGRGWSTGVSYYPHPVPITERFVKNLMDENKKIDFFKDLPIEAGGLQMKNQKNSNCYYVSPKTSVYALAHVLCPGKAKEFYKRFSAFAREYALRGYQEHISLDRQNLELLQKVEAKLSSKVGRDLPYYEKRLLDGLNEHIEKIRRSVRSE